MNADVMCAIGAALALTCFVIGLGVGFVIANRDRKLDIRPALRRDR